MDPTAWYYSNLSNFKGIHLTVPRSKHRARTEMATPPSCNPATQEMLQAQANIFNDVFSYIAAMSLKCAIELGIPDLIHVHGRPIAFSDLTSKLSIPHTKSSFLRRLMRLLVHKGYFTHQMVEDTYSLTPLSKLLLRDQNNISLSSWVLGMLDSSNMSITHVMSQWYRQNKLGTFIFDVFHGKPVWEFTSENPQFNCMFNQTMAADSQLTMKAVVTECRESFQGLKSLVDVGGGIGTSARAIAEAFPDIKCTVYDLPHVIATVPKTPLLDAVGGNMFDYIPHADAVFLKHILHDWSDEDYVKLLKRCREVIPPREDGGKVMIVDIVMDANNQNPITTEAQLLCDMGVLMCGEGKERDEHEWKRIFVDAGFKDYKISPLGVRSFIELFP